MHNKLWSFSSKNSEFKNRTLITANKKINLMMMLYSIEEKIGVG